MTRTITKVVNPVWGDAAHTSILCHVAIAEQIHPNEPPGFMYEFMCVANDVEEHGQQLWNDLNAGKYGAIGDYIALPAPAKAAAPVIAGKGPNVIK